MFPIVDLNETVTDCKLTVAVGEATDSGVSGVLTIIIKNGAQGGSHLTIVRNVTNLTRSLQIVTLQETPNTGKIHHVTAVLLLPSGESSSDDEFIQLCQA